jgi:hypothetical protein
MKYFKEKYDDISRWLNSNFFWYFRYFFRGVKNIIRWTPIIYHDRDWDHTFMTDILIKKLENQRDFFMSGNAYAARSEELATEIQVAINGLKKTKDSWDFYEEPAYDAYNEKWGKPTFSWEKKDDDLSEFKIQRSGIILTPELEEESRKEFIQVMEDTFKKYIDDKVGVYKYIAEHQDGWWD